MFWANQCVRSLSAATPWCRRPTTAKQLNSNSQCFTQSRILEVIEWLCRVPHCKYSGYQANVYVFKRNYATHNMLNCMSTYCWYLFIVFLHYMHRVPDGWPSDSQCHSTCLVVSPVATKWRWKLVKAGAGFSYTIAHTATCPWISAILCTLLTISTTVWSSSVSLPSVSR